METGSWTTWEIFSAIVSVGVVYRGHEVNAVELISNYFSSSELDVPEYGASGGLYALGLMHGNHGDAINDYLLKQLRSQYTVSSNENKCLTAS